MPLKRSLIRTQLAPEKRPYTPQEMFERVYRHFVINRKGPSVNASQDGLECVYRGPKGARCAAGLFIDKRKYSSDLEGLSVMSDHGAINRRLFSAMEDRVARTAEIAQLLSRLQECHDMAAGEAFTADCKSFSARRFHAGIKARLNRLADELGFTVPSFRMTRERH